MIEAAARTGTMLEINSNPDRRDLNDVNARAAAAAGVPIVINTDSHRTAGFAVARYGIATARRAWLTANAGGQHAAVERGGGAPPAPPARLSGATLSATSSRNSRPEACGSRCSCAA